MHIFLSPNLCFHLRTQRHRSLTLIAVRSIALLAVFGVLVSNSYSGTLAADPPKLSHATPTEMGLRGGLQQRVAAAVQPEIDKGNLPGCVVTIGYRGKIVLMQAYGDRQVEPERVAMTTDTVFDLASLTKPIATATSVMILLQDGKIRLGAKVSDYIPEFAANGKGAITIEQLLIHQGGLIPDNSLKDYQSGKEEAFRRIYALKPYVEPGTKFVYTDVGFIVLADIVERLTGKDVHQFSQERIFGPLGMKETGYVPDASLQARCAPHNQRDEQWIKGEVHDPRSYALGGIAGHAGLFSTATDLAVYAQMMLGGGRYHDVRVLGTPTVEAMTAPREVSSGIRGLGWDKQTGYSSNKGELLSDRAFGHGGFTGTAIWMDPEYDLFVIFLANRLHPDGKGSVNRLAGRIATLAAASINRPLSSAQPDSVPGTTTLADNTQLAGSTEQQAAVHSDILSAAANKQSAPGTDNVLIGIDVLQLSEFAQLRGQRVGLIANQTAIDGGGNSTIEILHRAPEVNLVALFSPEHGIAGKLDQAIIGDTKDDASGLKVFSLYGETRSPTEEALKSIDTLVFDIQDIGARFYTYISTMGLAMEACAAHNKRFVVLDRPNPINGVDVAGPVLDEGEESFVGFHTIAVRHGMTIGELARMFRAERHWDLDLEVVAMRGWRVDSMLDRTGLLWVNPSPNMRCLNQALLYPGVGLLETTNLSVGRGTDTPFEWVGAPWIEPQRLAQHMNATGLAGVRFVGTRFTPESSVYKQLDCGAVRMVITERSKVQPLRVGIELATALRDLYPNDWEQDRLPRLLCDAQTSRLIAEGKSSSQIIASWETELRDFNDRRRKFLIYPRD